MSNQAATKPFRLASLRSFCSDLFVASKWGQGKGRTLSIDRATVERLSDASIEIGELHRAGLLDGDRTRAISLPFRWPTIRRMRVDGYVVVLDLFEQQYPQHIRLQWTQPYFGGCRPWMLCPKCSARVARVHQWIGGFLCRKCCGNPHYATQCKGASSRRAFAVSKLRLRLGGEASLTAPFPDRPKGMHHRTYMRLKIKAERLEASLSRRLKTRLPDYPNLIFICHLKFPIDL